MLTDEHAAGLDERLGSGSFCSFIIPAACVTDFHRHRGADGLSTEIEGGVTGHDFRIGISADITHLRLVRSDLAVCDHLVEFIACNNACKIAAFVNRRKSVMEVGKIFGVGICAGRMCEFDILELSCSLHDVSLMAEAVRKDNVAALIDEVGGGIVACVTLGDTGLDDDSHIF